jgi:hypothetical protein
MNFCSNHTKAAEGLAKEVMTNLGARDNVSIVIVRLGSSHICPMENNR